MIWSPFANNVLRLAIRDMRNDIEYERYISHYRKLEYLMIVYLAKKYPTSYTGYGAKGAYERAIRILYGNDRVLLSRKQAILALYYAEDATRPWWRKRLTMNKE